MSDIYSGPVPPQDDPQAGTGYDAGYAPRPESPADGQTQQTPYVAEHAAEQTAEHAAEQTAERERPVPPAEPPVPGEGAPQPSGDGPKHRLDTGAKAVLLGLLGGVVGAAAICGVLLATHVVGPTSGSGVEVSGGGQQITIDPSDEDVTTANAVAAKALPSVVTVYCTLPEGEAMGSGVIYDDQGNILTNNHVIDGAESISVSLNGQSFDATVVGTDPSSDLAVLHVDFGDTQVTPIEVGSSSDLQVGDWVMSVGSPFGLESSVSQGIVSALSRSTLLQGTSGNTLYTNLIQTDATINPGNSGGALVNDKGQLVGICTLYSSDTESFAGIGYAIPSDYASEVADKIIAGEPVTHAYIGLSMQTVNAQTATRHNLGTDSGAYVVEVTDGGPAAQAGIQEGDVITAIGDDKVTSADSAILAVRSHEIGETVPVTVMRGSQELTLDVTLGSDETLQQQQQEQNDQTVNVDGQEISLQDLIDLYQQYEQMNPFGGR